MLNFHNTVRLGLSLACFRLMTGALLIASAPIALAAENKTPEKVARPDTVVVTATAETIGNDVHVVTDGDALDKVLRDGPFVMIRKGASCSTDLYADGFKRNDINVTVDGERYTTACPNRMDTRVGQVDLLDISMVDMSRTASGLQSGLGGKVNFQRRKPGAETIVYGQVVANLDNADDLDLSFSGEGKRMRLGTRYRQGSGWTDANGATFVERYNYREDTTYEVFEVRGHKAWDSGDAVGNWETSTDLLFPYLLMDERDNKHFALSASHKGHRVYLNHTAHLMDNGLRLSSNMTDMVTDADNTMFGAIGKRYEIFARNWNADNRITPVAAPAMEKLNHMLPDVWRYGGSFKHDVGDASKPWLMLRAGLTYTAVGDKAQLAAYRELNSEAELNKLSVPFGVTALHGLAVGKKGQLGLSAEFASDAPSIEQQYIVVRKPGGKPTWLGNPELADPIRATARAGWQCGTLRAEVFGTHVWNYPYLASQMVGTARYQTYEGVDALLAGASAGASFLYFDASVNWNWGEKTDTNKPLAEIQPLTFNLSAESPTFGLFYARGLYQHATGQHRVDSALDEETTGAWNRVDLGLIMEHDIVLVSLDVVNLTNVQYTQHLSYLRNPFASGLRVYEPGTVLKLTGTFAF